MLASAVDLLAQVLGVCGLNFVLPGRLVSVR